MLRVIVPVAFLILSAIDPAFAQSSTINATGSPTTPAPQASFTLGIAAASTANDRPGDSSAHGTTARVASNDAAVPGATLDHLRASTR